MHELDFEVIERVEAVGERGFQLVLVFPRFVRGDCAAAGESVLQAISGRTSLSEGTVATIKRRATIGVCPDSSFW